MSRQFYLVQRLSRKTREFGKGFDALFSCQYMGSAEFEFGALPTSLKRIRAARKVVIHEGQVTRKGITVPVFVVGDKKSVAAIPDALTEWLVDDYPRGKEMTYFPEYVEGTPRTYCTADAWWALDEDVMWTLDREIADDLMRAVTA